MFEIILGDALEVLIDHRGKTPKKLGGDFTSTGVPVASALLVKGGRLRLEEARCVSEEMYGRWMPVPTKKNDVILTSEGPLGECALVESDAPLVLGQRLFGLRGKEGLLDSRFLFYALRSEAVQHQLHARSSGTTVQGIRQSELVKIKLSVPSYECQLAVADILGAIDVKISLNERVISTAFELAEAYFSESRSSVDLSSFSIEDLVASGSIEFGDGYRTKKSEHGRPGIPILRVAEVIDGRIEAKLEDFVHENYRKSMQKKTSRLGDIVLTTKWTVGRVAVVRNGDPEFVYSPQLCYFRVNPSAPFSSSYFHFWLRSDEFRRQAASMKGQTDMADYLSLGDIKRLKISFPTSESGSRLTVVLRHLEALVESRLRENRTLSELRDTLLPKLISGEIRIKDAEKDVGDVA